MAQIDKLKEEIATKREFLRGLIIINIAILSGVVTVIYGVVANTLNLYMLVFVALGFIAQSIGVAILKTVYYHLDKLTKELENV